MIPHRNYLYWLQLFVLEGDARTQNKVSTKLVTVVALIRWSSQIAYSLPQMTSYKMVELRTDTTNLHKKSHLKKGE